MASETRPRSVVADLTPHLILGRESLLDKWSDQPGEANCRPQVAFRVQILATALLLNLAIPAGSTATGQISHQT